MNNIRKSFCGTKKSLFVLYCAHLFVPLPPEMNKNLYIISGCNGAGKTTASYTVLPEILDCKEFVNADEIARGLSPFNPESVAIEAGRLMLKRIDELLEKGKTFSIETTLATKSYINLVRRARTKGYVVTVLFFWLNSQSLLNCVFQSELPMVVITSPQILLIEDTLLAYATCLICLCKKWILGLYLIIVRILVSR